MYILCFAIKTLVSALFTYQVASSYNHPIPIFMSTFFEKQKRHAAAWILKSLSTNHLWVDESSQEKKSGKNYMFIPLFNIAEASKRYDLNTLKETCYLLKKNNHVTIWGDDFDARAMLVQISDEGIRAHRKSLYGNYTLTVVKRKLTGIIGIAAAIAIVIGVGKFTSAMKHQRFQTQVETKEKAADASQNATADLKKVIR
jgi:hypothetical protein